MNPRRLGRSTGIDLGGVIMQVRGDEEMDDHLGLGRPGSGGMRLAMDRQERLSGVVVPKYESVPQ